MSQQHSEKLLLTGAQSRGVELVLLTPLHTCTFPNRMRQRDGAGALCNGMRSVPPHAPATWLAICRRNFTDHNSEGSRKCASLLCRCTLQG